MTFSRYLYTSASLLGYSPLKKTLWLVIYLVPSMGVKTSAHSHLPSSPLTDHHPASLPKGRSQKEPAGFEEKVEAEKSVKEESGGSGERSFMCSMRDWSPLKAVFIRPGFLVLKCRCLFWLLVWH